MKQHATGDAGQPRYKTLEIGIHYGGGGEGRVLSELAQFLPSAGWQVIGAVAGPDDVGEQTGGDFFNFASESASKIDRFRQARAKIIQVLDQRQPDLVASHFALYAMPIVDRLKHQPFVHHFHGPWGAESAQDGASSFASAWRAWIERAIYSRAQRIIVLSEAFARLAEHEYKVDPQRIRIVPGCVDIDRFHTGVTRRQARERLGLPVDRPILLSVRRLVKRMGLLELLSAMPAIVQNVPDVLLCIAGRGLLKDELAARVRDSSLENHVRFLGYVKDEDLPFLYRAADINVVPTNALEGFGLVAAEALAAGTPSMVTRVGGLPEVVSALSQDLIVKSSEPPVLAEALTAALTGQSALPSAEACTAYAAQNFRSSLMAERTAAVYQELL